MVVKFVLTWKRGKFTLKIENSRVQSLPNVVSFVALFFSCISILLLLNGRFYFSFSFVLLAFILDALDGYLARRLGQESSFGRQLDGFVDVFIFLIYPVLAFYLFFGLKDMISTTILFGYIATGIFRLARFNMTGFATTPERDQMSYPGLPVFCNHITILFLLALRQFSGTYFFLIADTLLVLNSILMVQKFPFPKPKTLWPFILLILLVSVTMAWIEFYGVR